MADYRNIIQSQHFTFLVGEENSPMTVHADIVKDVSEPLHTIISNEIQNSTSRITVLENTEVDTFAGFCEYLYTGSYTTPSRATSDASEKSIDEQSQPQKTSDVTPKSPQSPSFPSTPPTKHQTLGLVSFIPSKT